MTIVYPVPLSSIAEYHQELARIEQQIAALEQQLGQLRRLRGCRLMQLADQQGKEVES